MAPADKNAKIDTTVLEGRSDRLLPPQEKKNGKEPEKPQIEEKEQKPPVKPPPQKIQLDIDREALKRLKLVIVAYSHVEREWFPTKESYEAEVEVEERAGEVAEAIKKLGINVKAQAGNQYFLTNLLVDQPSLVLNLVDTLKGKDRLQTSVPAALELSGFPYTGAGIVGLVIGNNRNITKRLLSAYDIPTPSFQYIRRTGTAIQEDLGLPLIVKLNESGGSVGIDRNAVKESFKDAQKKVDEMIGTYKMPVIVERFVSGPEVTVIIFDDGTKSNVLMAEKVIKKKPDGKHAFTSIESYEDKDSYKYRHFDNEMMRTKIEKLAIRAFNGLEHKDYAKFDVRIDDSTNTPYFTDSNPNTAFGPDKGLPMTEVADIHGVTFDDILASLLSKYAKAMR